MNRKHLYIGFLLALVVWACESTTNADQQKAPGDPSTGKPGIEDAKPMAKVMRAMYVQAAAMHDSIEAGKTFNATIFPVIRFHDQEPTDSTVLTPEFQKKADTYYAAMQELQAQGPDGRKAAFNHLLQTCITCHQENCPGPISKIKRLILP
jgi:hypothetical protein